MNIFKTSALAVLLFGATYATALPTSTDSVTVAVTFGDYIEIIDFNVVSADAAKTDGEIDITPVDTGDDPHTKLDVLVKYNSSQTVDFLVEIAEVKKEGTDDVTDKAIFYLEDNQSGEKSAGDGNSDVVVLEDMKLYQDQDKTDYDEPWDLRDTDWGSDKEWTIMFKLTATSNN